MNFIYIFFDIGVVRNGFFKSDGTKLYEIGASGDKIYQYSCSSAWDLSTCTYDNVNVSSQGSFPEGIFFKSDGTKLYEIGALSTDKIYQYSFTSELTNSFYIEDPGILMCTG